MTEGTEKQHISYKEYQKKVTKKSNDGIKIFVSAFFILLLLFLGIAKQISPDVDVSIGGDEVADSETMGIEKTSVDERLKLLQMEDAETNKKETEEVIEIIPSENKQDVKTDQVKTEEAAVSKLEPATQKPAETASPAPKATQQAVSSKVVVGYYSTKEQAEVAKGIIAEAGLNISPFVRSIGGAYTIQVGSYSTREKAQNVMNELLRNNYPARIINE